ncbi:MAG TPA: sugar phosphate isomerase/epimerase [Paludibaculum sp.]|jgi:sugar phosphate isomerase/epimerase
MAHLYSRREFGYLAAAPLAALAQPDSVVGGVQIGAQTNSFSDRSLDDAISAMLEIGISGCELWQGHVEPRALAGKDAELSRWREETPASYFRDIAAKLRTAGIRLYAYDFQFRESFTDREIVRALQIGHELGAPNMVTSSATLPLARRMAPFLEKQQMPVGMHGRTNVTDPNEFAGPGNFERALAASPNIGVNLDLGHYTAAGFDAVEFIRQHHGRILSIHLKDRLRKQGRSVAFGEGDTPIRECLQLLKRNGWKIPAHIEHDRGGDRVAEFRKSYEYCRKALA